VPLPPRREIVLYLLLWPLLALRHLSLYYRGTEFAHFDHIVWNLERLEAGKLWVKSPNLWETSLQPGGPLYYWLHLPALLFEQPVVGLHVYYGLLEMAAITFFLLWALRGKAALPRELAWAAAIFLAVFGDGKLVIAENMTIATYLSLALFMATLRGLQAPRARAMILPGLLLGATIQVHLATLYLAPVVFAAVLLERRDRVARLLWLMAGGAVVVAVMLPGMLRGIPDSLGSDPAVASLVTRFEISRVAQRLAFALHDPLSLLGLGLALTAWIRGRAGTVERLAVLWLVAGYLTLGVALSYMSLNWNESRFATINGARAVLDALALFWLARAAAKIPGPGRALAARAPEPITLLAGVAAAGVLLLGGLTFAWRADAADRGGMERADPCQCDLWAHETEALYVNRLVDRLSQVGLPELDAERLVVSGPLRERLGALIHWLNRERRLALREGGKAGTGANLLATPALARFDLSRLPGAVSYGPILFVPRALPLTYRPADTEGAVTFDMNQVPDGHGLLMITVHGDAASSAARQQTLRQGGDALTPLDACRCDTGQDYRRYADWILYRVPAGASTRSPFTLKLGKGYEDREAIWVVALPTNPGAEAPER